MKNRTIAWMILAFILVTLACGRVTPTPTPAHENTTENMAPDPTLSPPLADVDFPDQVVDYPSDWPGELRYPKDFQPADLASGVFPSGSQVGWSVKLRYPGSPEEAAQALSAFFTQQGWQVVEQTGLDSGGFLLIIEKGSQGSGLLVIDSNPTGGAVVLATIYSE